MKTAKITPWDDRRDLIILKDREEALSFALEHWTHTAKRALQQRGFFSVALSGGSTPKALYEKLALSEEIDWERVHLFWSDERAHPPTHPESNYKMAMDAGLAFLPIPKAQIHRMVAEKEIEKNAQDYEDKIKHLLGKRLFDLVMLGVGEDGHTASLFPNSNALAEMQKWVAANSCGDKGMRMTLTFPCINESHKIAVYAFGASKKDIILQVLNAPIDSPWPASRIGSLSHKALWILDQSAAASLKL